MSPANSYRSLQDIEQSGFVPICVPDPSRGDDAHDHDRHDHMPGERVPDA